MTACVLDANIAAKWFLPSSDEKLFAEARELLLRHQSGKLEFLVPDIFWAECGNIFWKATRSGRCSRHDAEVSLSTLKAGRLVTIPASELVESAFSIAITFTRSFYDSLYVALAVQSGTQLVTADEKLSNALAGKYPVKWLGSI